METTSETTIDNVGSLLREWRQRRRFSQLDLASEAALSTRHLSFVESGRASASRDMLIRLAEHLAMPLRIRNRLLLAGGYAPEHAERPLDARDMTAAREAVEAVLAGHMPFPALAVDRHWNLVLANPALAPFLAGVEQQLLTTPVNVLRLSLHPEGLAPRIDNLAEWRHHLLERLARQCDETGDPVLADLLAELSTLPFRASRARPGTANAIAVPLRLRADDGACLSFISTTTVFGTATDVTLAELTLECFYPADAATRTALLNAPLSSDAVGASS
ncbi:MULTISPECIES: helix-turn-helix transcriptional regulator [unclassified Chelatococcus]|jgi:transcriptional regulator with XRE-family HTH domain|uniref:helix-turn-helix domain-containing protein n=1 Tax=unclassified Chelatococcus TaxID=2638111 RepID=UPI001BD15E0B|nr:MULTISPECIES: helix-turn-helix transcriptional regulator [unclassified Chelatococcus]CAH1659167.1 Helix-turn-helix protein [Hyphomicrobiales bacterium]MBS7740905.1 helix-turn-helix transcriptional regulator [Chelatococcus sp. HY11]MBX3546804.1 helix-turn-helix transcriptional regulator [Chelatococcus sp.]MCO5077723.1 helix-turn-helix transcriptional regulator [Chelatococcus sp.]CAH1683906.1 Helix-turn-helix protein [Hyphomicrobiales bacterium]